MANYVVKPGDNLTRIARHFGVGHWREIYEHPRNADFRRKRPNPNLIFPGDVLYIPGQGGAPRVIDLGETIITATADPDQPVKDLPEKERKKLLKEIQDDLPADWKHWAEEDLAFVSLSLTLAQLAELGTVLSHGAWLMASPLTLAIRIFIGWGAALEVNERMYGYRAVAYTTTAWAFGRNSPPQGSPEMMRRFEQHSSRETIQRRREAWREASHRNWQQLETLHQRERVSKEVMRAAIKLEGISKSQRSYGTPEEKLCLYLLKSFESEFRAGINRENWRQGYSVLYPR